MKSIYKLRDFNFIREVVEKTESLQSYLMLGDAYMDIQEVHKCCVVNFISKFCNKYDLFL